MKTATEDVLDLLDYVWSRLETRLDGLTDAEWSWRPSPRDPDVSIEWRLRHLTAMLTDPRNAEWLGRPGIAREEWTPTSATSAREALSDAYAVFRATAGAAEFDLEIGAAAGSFATATRRAFVLHVADELIHHSAEAALLRDLYASLGPTQDA